MDDLPRHLRLAMSQAQRAFERDEPYTLATINENLQPLVDAAIQWGKRGAKMRPERLTVGDYRNANNCHADRDGECSWEGCPQLADGEPGKTGRHCPLDTEGS